MRGSGFSSTTGSGTGTPNIATGQVSIDTTVGGTLLVAARAVRSYVEIRNLGANDVAIGNTGLTFANGKVLRAGESIVLYTTAAIYAIAAAAASNCDFEEIY